MQKKDLRFIRNSGGGVIIGVINGLLGAGGGLLAVPLLKLSGMKQQDAHANAVAVILPIALMSAGLYLFKGSVGIKDAIPYIPTGVLGSVIGTVVLKKISPILLRAIFGGFMIYASLHLLMP